MRKSPSKMKKFMALAENRKAKFKLKEVLVF